MGGATLGGSGKTRVALACARELATLGANVVLVGHAYRASPLRARVVGPNDPLGEVGDEALVCARSLQDCARARVVVAATRQAAVDLALSLFPRVDVLVLDGPLQLAPEKATLSLLALDASAPWGAGTMIPAGDLRAPKEALLAEADSVVAVDALPVAVRVDGHLLELSSFVTKGATARIGLFTAIARPDRLERALRGAGLRFNAVVRAPDHGPLAPALAFRIAEAPVELWVATAKCAVHLEALSARARKSVAILEDRLHLTPDLIAKLHAAWTLRLCHVP